MTSPNMSASHLIERRKGCICASGQLPLTRGSSRAYSLLLINGVRILVRLAKMGRPENNSALHSPRCSQAQSWIRESGFVQTCLSDDSRCSLSLPDDHGAKMFQLCNGKCGFICCSIQVPKSSTAARGDDPVQIVDVYDDQHMVLHFHPSNSPLTPILFPCKAFSFSP